VRHGVLVYMTTVVPAGTPVGRVTELEVFPESY